MTHRFNPPTRAFTLIELLVVISIISILIALLMPNLARARYNATSAKCAARKQQLNNGLINYAVDNQSWFPHRWPQNNTYNHPFWWGRPNHATQDMHEVVETYLGSPSGGLAPPSLLCAVEPQAVWGQPIQWPLSGIYRSNVAVTGGWDWSTTSSSACVPLLSLDQMPMRANDVNNRPICGDLIEYMTGNSGSYSGWVVGHTYNPAYHFRNAAGPEEAPPDPIPFGIADGSVDMASDLEGYYLDPGWGIKYWPAK